MLTPIKIMLCDYIDRIESSCKNDDREAVIELEHHNNFGIYGREFAEVHMICNYWNRIFRRC